MTIRRISKIERAVAKHAARNGGVVALGSNGAIHGQIGFVFAPSRCAVDEFATLDLIEIERPKRPACVRGAALEAAIRDLLGQVFGNAEPQRAAVEFGVAAIREIAALHLECGTVASHGAGLVHGEAAVLQI